MALNRINALENGWMVSWRWRVIITTMDVVVLPVHVLESVAWGIWLRHTWFEAVRQINHFITSRVQSALFEHAFKSCPPS